MDDRYFVALGWIGLAVAVAVDTFDRVAAWARREVAMARAVIRRP